MSRLDRRFAALREEGRAGFVAYVMAGDPDGRRGEAILAGLARAGADVIELGYPFSDPMAEGVPIQLASQRALASGTTLRSTLSSVARFRADDDETPLVLMGYLNPILSFGYAAFARAAADAGVDGLIVVDCPPEESEPLVGALGPHAIALIRLASPTTDDARLEIVARGSSGFVYYVSVAGVTGTKEADADAVAPAVARMRAATGLPVAVGFGVRTPERAAAVARVADAVVVGSALVDAIARAEASGGDAAAAVHAQARALAQAVRGARRAAA